MKSVTLASLVLAACGTLLVISPSAVRADAARVEGNLQVDGLYFSGDTNKTVITKPSDFSYPWTILGPDIYFGANGGNVGIGTMNPSARLDVNGTVKAGSFSGDGSFLTNIRSTLHASLADFATYAYGMTALSSVPINPIVGQMYYDVVTKSPMMYTGSAWMPLGRNVSYVSGLTQDATDDGLIAGRSLSFTKLLATSRLRITWSDNLRVLGPNASCQWEVLIDAASATPQLKTSLYVDAGLMHRQSTLVGYATGLGAGAHIIQIKVSRPLTAAADCYTGWESTFLLEAEEMY